MKVFEYIKRDCVLISLLFFAVGCNSWLDIKPENEQTLDDFWKTKEDVSGVLASAYSGMRDCLPSFMDWGELRADAIDLGPSAWSNLDMVDMTTVNIRPDNSLIKWDKFYTVIGRCNSVIKYAPGVLSEDPTFKKVLCNAYIAEAVWVRAYMYFFLVKNFKDVPYITEPYVTDDQDFNIAKSTDDTILSSLVTDLEAHLMQCPPSYVYDWETKGRATRWAYYALLADIAMWTGDYDNAVKYSDKIIENTDYELLETESWYQAYYPGNSTEGIFELQWDEQHQNGELYNATFSGLTSNSKYQASFSAMMKYDLFEDEEDIRGEGGSFLASAKLWKFAGKDVDIAGGMTRAGNERVINWPIYRLSDIMLTKALALAFKDDYSSAAQIVNQIRTQRGYVTELPIPSDKESMIAMVLDEREREFLCEGKRWYDLLCVAKQNNYEEKDKLIDIMLEGVSIKDRDLLRLRLQDIHGFYLPIHEDEIDNSEDVLVQNPFYQSID